MLQSSESAVLIRAAMEVLALKPEEDFGAVAAIITKEQLATVGMIMFERMYVCRNYHTNCVMLCRCRDMFSECLYPRFTSIILGSVCISCFHCINTLVKYRTVHTARTHSHAHEQAHANVYMYGLITNTYYCMYIYLYYRVLQSVQS